ncbi:unnamed protein product, partial [Brassicogethes aeneus]
IPPTPHSQVEIVSDLVKLTDLVKLANLDAQCVRCICYAATGCDLTRGCVDGYCGPFKISKIYWVDAGEELLPNDEKKRPEAYEDCALYYNCAYRSAVNYFTKYGKDCNEDGVTNCVDYAMIHFNGGWQCQPALNRTKAGKAYLERYRLCDPVI